MFHTKHASGIGELPLQANREVWAEELQQGPDLGTKKRRQKDKTKTACVPVVAGPPTSLFVVVLQTSGVGWGVLSGNCPLPLR